MIFIDALGGAGAFTLFTAGLGLYSSTTGRVCCVNLYMLCVCLLLVVQGAIVGLVYTKNLTFTGDVDPRVRRVLENQQEVLKYAGIGVLALQVMCLVMASCLKRTKWRPAEDEDSDDEWEAQYARRKQRKEPLLPKDKTPVSEKNEAWSARMREKYGLDTAQFAYTVEEDTEEEPAKRSCAIM
tara:strand:- start:59 stop:607 length:549 start_codon:yes stop_codon:yes gene_type:complete